MSVKTWINEFCPEDVYTAGKGTAGLALQHSIRKWTGLLEENLKKHGCTASFGIRLNIHDECDEWLPSEYIGCALCEWSWRQGAKDGDSICPPCPLYKARGGYDCNTARPDETESPWRHYRHTLDARPMLKWLHRTQKLLQRGKLK